MDQVNFSVSVSATCSFFAIGPAISICTVAVSLASVSLKDNAAVGGGDWQWDDRDWSWTGWWNDEGWWNDDGSGAAPAGSHTRHRHRSSRGRSKLRQLRSVPRLRFILQECRMGQVLKRCRASQCRNTRPKSVQLLRRLQQPGSSQQKLQQSLGRAHQAGLRQHGQHPGSSRQKLLQ